MKTTLCLCSLSLFATGLSAQHYVRGSYGFYTDANHGAAIAIAGDMNGDGVFDYLVGAPGRSTTTTSQIGQVTIYSGDTGLVIGGALGTRAGRRLGTAIAALGDVSGDGVPDFATSSPHDNQGGTNAGYLAVYSGATSLLLWERIGGSPGSRFGEAVLGVPDMNGDGVTDIAVSQPLNTASLPTGRVYFYSGTNGTLLRTLTSQISGDRFGTALALVGDQNGDNVPELAIGAPGGPGIVYVHASGSTTLPLVWSSVQGPGFGRAISGAGDVNDDGVPDVLVGREQTASLPGAHYLLSGATTQVLRSQFGQNGQVYAHAVAGGRDVNADGVPDYLIGAPGGGGFIEVRSGKTGGLLFSRTGVGNEAMGTAVALMPDLNDDNLAEAAYGLPGYDNGGTANAGQLEVRGYDLPGSATYYGPGCGGPAAARVIGTDASTLKYGGSVQCAVGNQQANSLGAWVIGFAMVPLGVPLAGLGMPGCSLYTTPDVLLPFLTSPTGTATLAFTIPNNFGMVGRRLGVQALVPHDGATPANLLATHGYELQIGRL